MEGASCWLDKGLLVNTQDISLTLCQKFYRVPFYKSTFLCTWILLKVYSVFIFCTHTVLCVDFTSLYDYYVPVVSWLLEYFSCRQICVIKSFTPPQKKNTSFIYIYIGIMFPSTKTFRWIIFLESNIPFLFWHRRFWSVCKLCAGQMLTFQQASRAQRSFAFAPTKAIFTFFGAIPFGQLKVTTAPPNWKKMQVFCYSDLTYGDCFFWRMKDGMKMFLLVLAVAEDDTDWL